MRRGALRCHGAILERQAMARRRGSPAAVLDLAARNLPFAVPPLAPLPGGIREG